MNRTELKKFLRIPDNHGFESGDGVSQLTRRIDTKNYYESDPSGKTIAHYLVVQTSDFEGGGTLTWKRTSRS